MEVNAVVHYHVNRHDAGYLPSESNDHPYEDFESAWESVKWEVDSHIDYYAQGDENEPIRGQISTSDGSRTLVTAKDEIAEVERQVAEFERRFKEEPDFLRDARAFGVRIVLEDGISMIEADPCNEDCKAEE